MTRRHRSGPRSAAPVPPLDDDDLLTEILLRLPPRPSSLPRAAAVCKRWSRLVSDPHFPCRFRDRHGTPLLGFYHVDGTFVPTQEPPDRLPAARFSLNPDGAGGRDSGWIFLTCSRGRILAWNEEEFLVLDPMAGLWRRIPSPGKYKARWLCAAVAAVVPPAGGASDRSLFRFRLVALFRDGWRTGFACVYSSDSGAWDDSVATLSSDSESSPVLLTLRPGGSIVGNAVYWMLHGLGKAILEFDLGRQSLAFIQLPPDANVGRGPVCRFTCQIMPAESGQLGLIVLAGLSMQFWERETSHGSPARWVLHKTVQSDKFLPLGCSTIAIVGFCEESNALFLRTDGGVFMVQLETRQYRKVLDEVNISNIIPYASF